MQNKHTTLSDEEKHMRHRNAASAIGSVRLEGLEPSQYVKDLMYEYCEGTITAKEMHDLTLAHVYAQCGIETGSLTSSGQRVDNGHEQQLTKGG